jgi:ATP adenylyltransferase
MEHLWSPWRYRYIATADKVEGCVFCRVRDAANDDENYIVHRGQLNFVILNLFPYTSGHLMVVPYEHAASFADADEDVTAEMIRLAKQSQRALEAEYHPDGFNIGINLGRAAGAGVADHLHLHVVPRWVGDTNFMPALADTRVMPQHLDETWQTLREAWVRYAP